MYHHESERNHINEQLKNLYGNRGYNDIKESFKEINRIAQSFSFLYDSSYLKNVYSKEEIDDLEKWLGISFSYMSSFDRRFFDRDKLRDKRDHAELMNFTAGLTAYFKFFYLKNNIKILINTIEDDIFSIVAYYVAKKLKIKIIGINGGRFPKSGLMFCEDFVDICEWRNCDVKFEDILAFYDDSPISGKEVMEKNISYWSFRSIFLRIKGVYSVIKYQRYVKEIIKRHYNEKFILDPSINVFDQIIKYFVKLIRLILMKIIMKKPDFNDNYFLFTLHFFEDAQMTFREPLLDQFELIKSVSRSLPTSYSLYVKPHPHYLGTDLSSIKIYNLSKLKNIKIIDPNTPNKELLKNTAAVITINSTTGFESIIMGVPVITFGHDFYCKNKYCTVVRDLNNLSEFLINSINFNSIDYKEVRRFVKKIYCNTVWINAIDYDYGFYGLEIEDGKKLAIALNKIIDGMEV